VGQATPLTGPTPAWLRCLAPTAIAYVAPPGLAQAWTSIASPFLNVVADMEVTLGVGRYCLGHRACCNAGPLGQAGFGDETTVTIDPGRGSNREGKKGSSRAARAVAAVQRIQAWLDASVGQVAAIAGFAERSYHNWQLERSPRPSSVRRLFEVHAVLSGLVDTLDIGGTRAWLDQPSMSGEPRRALLLDSKRMGELLLEARNILFPRATSTSEDWKRPDYEEPLLDVAGGAEGGSIRRARRLP